MKKTRILALGLALLLALALTACGGTGGAPAAEAPDYLGTYNLVSLTLGPLTMAPDEFGYDGAFLDLKESDKLTFNDGTDSEVVPYTVDGSSFTLTEGSSTLKGTLENDRIDLNFTGADLDMEGDDVFLVMHFALADSEAEAAIQEELESLGSMEAQLDAMSAEDLASFVDEYGAIFGE